MARRPFHSSHAAPKHTRTSAHNQAINTSRARAVADGVTVLPLHSPVVQRRAALCDALTELADTWRALDVRDERAWAAFVADATLALARHCVQHAADLRALPTEADEAFGSNTLGAEMDPRVSATNVSDDAKAANAADAAVLAYLGLVDALSPAAAMSEIVDAAVALGVIDDDSGTGVSMDASERPRGVPVGVRGTQAPIELQAS